MNDRFLIGKRIYLRYLNLSDIEGNYIKWFNDAEVCANNSHHIFPYTSNQAEEYITRVNKDKYSLVLACVLKKSNEHIGNISLQNINNINRSAEFAIIIGEKKYWGKGYAKEGSLLILKHGFFELNLHRIYCGTPVLNKSMQNLAVSLGMKEEGKRRQAFYKHGTYQDILEYGILRQEFLRNYNDMDKTK